MAMTFQLKDFDGPLDLLLFLINKEKIDIKDIFVSQITDQYIDSVRNAPDLDMDDATDFLVMAATLLEIKSRAMLPRPPRIEEGEEDPEEALIRRLEEYKCFRETASAMKQFEQAASRGSMDCVNPMMSELQPISLILPLGRRTILITLTAPILAVSLSSSSR